MGVDVDTDVDKGIEDDIRVGVGVGDAVELKMEDTMALERY